MRSKAKRLQEALTDHNAEVTVLRGEIWVGLKRSRLDHLDAIANRMFNIAMELDETSPLDPIVDVVMKRVIERLKS